MHLRINDGRQKDESSETRTMTDTLGQSFDGTKGTTTDSGVENESERETIVNVNDYPVDRTRLYFTSVTVVLSVL